VTYGAHQSAEACHTGNRRNGVREQVHQPLARSQSKRWHDTEQMSCAGRAVQNADTVSASLVMTMSDLCVRLVCDMNVKMLVGAIR
jgi:hypothetical protein